MKISEALLLLSAVLTALGGVSDMTGWRPYGLTRQHLWNDGMYAAVLAIAVHLIYRG